MKVLVTGATGYTGSYTVPLLLERGIQVRCLVRKTSRTDALAKKKLELVYGDLADSESISQALEGVDALVNIASIGFGHAPQIVQALVSQKVSRAVFISTTAIFTTLDAKSKSVRLAAEKTIRSTELGYTILRPTMIYGSAGDRNIARLIRFLRKWRLVPVIGNGEYLQQPIYVGDVARAVVDALLSENTIGETYNISGGSVHTFNQIIDIVCARLNRRVFKIGIPASPVIAVMRSLEKFHIRLPVKSEQILRLNENKNFEHSGAARDFGFEPISFSEGIQLELEALGMTNQQPPAEEGA